MEVLLMRLITSVDDLTTPGYKRLRGEYDATASGDSFGDALAFHFAIAAAIYHDDPNDVPASWRYRHTPMCDYPERCRDADFTGGLVADGLRKGMWDLDDLRTFGDILSTYVELIREAKGY
jgi:hypothetical protein